MPAAMITSLPPIDSPNPAKINHSDNKRTTAPSPLDAYTLTLTPTSTPKPLPTATSPSLLSHRCFTDHMITTTWTLTDGWSAPHLSAFSPLSLSPSASALHYATQCFEGLKLYRSNHDGKLRLLRPLLNCERMRRSAARVMLPDFGAGEVVALVKRLCAVEGGKWLPVSEHAAINGISGGGGGGGDGSFAYVRPALMGTDPSLGFRVPEEAVLVIFICFWPHPNPEIAMGGNLDTLKEKKKEENGDKGAIPMGKGGLRLLASREDAVRAWPGGTGYAKVGANYGPSLVAHSEAKRLGYDQVLWLFGSECLVTEAGGCNFFVVWRAADTGRLQLVTAPLDDGTILAGVTRQCILDLARERLAGNDSQRIQIGAQEIEVQPLEVLEKHFTMFDVVSAAEEGRLLASFAVGTAYYISPVSHIRFRNTGIDLDISVLPHVALLRQWMSNIVYGIEEHPWAEVVEEDVI